MLDYYYFYIEKDTLTAWTEKVSAKLVETVYKGERLS